MANETNPSNLGAVSFGATIVVWPRRQCVRLHLRFGDWSSPHVPPKPSLFIKVPVAREGLVKNYRKAAMSSLEKAGNRVNIWMDLGNSNV